MSTCPAMRWEYRCDSELVDDEGRPLVERYDVGGELMPPQIRADGTMLVEGRVARPGVLRYRRADGSILRELVPREELHNPASLATMERVAVTLEHPSAGFVSPDNVSNVGVGDVGGTVRVDSDGFVRIEFAIRRADAIKAVKGGKRALSPGYHTRIDATPGVDPEFGPYDQVQRGRIYNHVAICDRARGGRAIHLRADAACELLDNQPEEGGPLNPKLIALLTLLGVERAERFDSDDAGLEELHRVLKPIRARADSVDAITAERDVARGERDTAVTERDTAVTERDTAVAERDVLKARVDAIDAAEAKRVEDAERKRLAKLAGRFDSVTADPKTAKLDELGRAIAGAHLSKLGRALPEDASDGYVRGILATIPETRTDSDPWSDVTRPRQERTDDDEPQKREDAPKLTLVDGYYNRADEAFKASRGGAR